MTDKKPMAVKVAIGLILLKLLFILLTIGLFYFIKDMDLTEESAMAGIRDGIIHKFNLNSTALDYDFGRLIGKLLIPALLATLIFIFIVKRNFWLTISAVSIDLLVGFSQGFPILTIVLFIIVLTNPTRNYLKNKTTAQNLAENDG